MTGGVKSRTSSRTRAYRTILAAGLILLGSVPGAFSDAFGFLPAKEVLRVRQILASLDKSLETWNTVEGRFAEEVWKARRKAAGSEDAKRLKSLLEAGATGSWAAGKGPSLARAESDSAKQAKQLEAALEPFLGRLDQAALKDLHGELMSRARRVPGAVPEYLDFAGRTAEVDPAGARFAVRALLGLVPETLGLRLAQVSGDSGKPKYAPPAPLIEEANRILLIREAREALRPAVPALAVPELAWTGEESAAAEAAARALSRLPPDSRYRVLETVGLPGLRMLPAFLSGLSPEDRQTWSRERGISRRAAETFRACLPPAAEPAPGPSSDPGSAAEARLRTLGALERDIAKGASGIALLSSLTDPALRLALRSPDAPRSVREALSASVSLLASDLEASLSRTAGGVHIVETEGLPGSSGFTAVRAYRVLPDGARLPVPPATLDTALEALVSFSPKGTGKTVSGPAIGLLTIPDRSGPEDGSAAGSGPVYRGALDAAGDSAPSTFAALASFQSDGFRQACRAAGIPPATLLPPVLISLSALCEARCRGLAGDADVEAALSRAGGPAGVRGFWDEAFLDLEAVRRAVDAYAGREGAR